MHLFLVGPPGIGKSTVAPLLAGMLGASVFETDRAIARRARKSNKEVIEQDGMDSFRDLESRVIASLRPTPAWIVVDTGGGAPIREENRKRMRELGLIIGLRGSVERITAGIAHMSRAPQEILKALTDSGLTVPQMALVAELALAVAAGRGACCPTGTSRVPGRA